MTVTMSAVWDRTTEFLSDNAGAVAGIAALTLFVPTVVEGILAPVHAAAQPGGPKTLLAIVMFVIAMLNLFGQGVLTALAVDPARGQRGAFATGTARFPALIGVSIVLFVLVMALVMPPIVLLAVEGVDFAAMTPGWASNLSTATVLFVSLYFLILTPLLIWACARLSVLLGVVVGERLGFGAIRRTWALTRGAALRIAGAVILLLVVGGVAVLAAETVFGSVFRIVFGSEGLVNPATVLTAVFVALVSTALSVIVTAFLAKLYVALAARAEAAVPA